MTDRIPYFGRFWLTALLFGVATFLTAKLSTVLSVPQSTYVSFWLPAGLYVGVLVLHDLRHWPGFVVAAMAANLLFDLQSGTPFATALGFCATDTLEALAGAWLVRRWVAPTPKLGTLNEFLGLLGAAAILSPALGAALGAGTLRAAGISQSFWTSWMAWWLNNAMAVLLVAPFILVWFSKPITPAPFFTTRAKLLEAAVLALALAGCTWYVLVVDKGINAPYKSRLLPLLLWAGLRFGARGATAANLGFALLMGFFTTHYLKGLPLSEINSGAYVGQMQSFLMVSVILVLIPTIVIQERDQKMLALQESEERFRTLSDNLPDSMVYQLLQNADGTMQFLHVSAGLERLNGLSAEAVRANFSLFFDQVAEEDRTRIRQARDASEKAMTVFNVNVRMRHANGSWRWVNLRSAPRRLPNGCVLWDGIETDITERQRAETLADGQKQVLEMIARDAPTPAVLEALLRVIESYSEEMLCSILLLDPDGLHLRHGAAPRLPAAYCQAIDGVAIGPCVGSCGTAAYRRAPVVVEDIATDPLWADYKAVALPHGLRACWSTPLFDAQQRVLGTFAIYYRQPGLPGESHRHLIELATHTATIAIDQQRAKTALRESESRLRQSQKMEGIGQLAGGVAHDFNNILSALLLQTDLLLTSEPLPAAAQAGLQDIRADIDRAAALTRQLLLFGRRQVMQVRLLDLNELVLKLGRMLQRIIGEDVQLQLFPHPVKLMTRADAGMIEQVLMNLCLNARDAMPRGGRLLIKTMAADVDEETARANPEATAGRHVCLSVTDTGPGIPPEILPKIFEPFFTTKEVGKGTGLGLATVYGIVKQHQGWIKVENRPAEGVTFQIFLPASAEQEASGTASNAAPQPGGGTETILVVEDEESVRKPICRLLERYGYQFLEAANGIDALQCWKKNQESVSLLLTDLVMPEGMNGRELARQLLAQRPQLKVIYTSGYSADIAGRDFELQPGEAFIQKPFPPAQLMETIRRSLDA